MSKRVYSYKWVSSANGPGDAKHHTMCVQLEGETEPWHVLVTTGFMENATEVLRSVLARGTFQKTRCTCHDERSGQFHIP